MCVKKLKTELTYVKRYNILKEYDEGLESYLISYNNQIVMQYIPFLITDDEKKVKKMSDIKEALKYFVVHNKFIKKVNTQPSFFKKLQNDFYEMDYDDNQYCGVIIIPRGFKQKPKDLLKEILLSAFNVKMIPI